MTTPLRSFLPRVIPHAYGCPEPTAQEAVLDACIEFCTKSSLIQMVDTQMLVPGRPDYDVGESAEQRLSQVISVAVGAVMLQPVAPSDVRSGAAMRAGTDTVVPSDTGTPTLFYQITPTDRVVYLWPVPVVAAPLAVRAAYTPSRTATEVDDVLFMDFVDDIACGALARLLAMPGQVFSNPKYAEWHLSRFNAAVARATSYSRRGRLAGALRTQGRAFA